MALFIIFHFVFPKVVKLLVWQNVFGREECGRKG